MMKNVMIAAVLSLGAGSLFADVVWKENFSSGASMEENGYKASIPDPTGKVELKDGEMVFHCAPGKSFHYTKSVPELKKGKISFELNLNRDKARYFNNLSFRFGAYGLLVYANGGARSLMMHNSGKNYDKAIHPIWNNQWKKIAIVFDTEEKTVKYYVDDMYNPVFEESDVIFKPAYLKNPVLSIGNYGNAKDTIVNCIRNLQIEDLAVKADGGEESKPAAPVVVWQEDFSKGSTMDANGYKASVSEPTGKVELNGGEMVFHCAPGKSFHYSKPLPKVRKGEISFELNLNRDKARYFNNLSFRLGAYGTLIYANGGARSLMMHNSGKNYDKAIHPIWNNQWKKIAIRFDMEEKTIKYFVDDMEKPVFEETDVKFHPSVSTAPMITIGNYGNAKDTIVNCIRNLKVTADPVEPSENEGKVVWTEDFSKGSTMEANGYRKGADNGKDKAEIRDGVMYYRCETSPYNGSYYLKKIPFVTKGELSFDLKVNAEKATNYTHLSLTVTLYEALMICPHGSNKFLQRYNPGTQRNNNLAPLKDGEWYRVAIRFDLNKRTVEYYVNDMENPVFTDEYFPFNMNMAFNSNLKIGNYGLAPGAVLNCLRNIQLKDLSAGDPDLERIVWKEDFSKGSTPEENGYSYVQKNPNDKIEIKDNTLSITCTPGPHKGSHIVKEMPMLRKGELSFYLKVNAKKISKSKYNQLSFQVFLYESLMLCPHGSPGTLQRYNPGVRNNSIISKLKDGEWHKIMLRYDIEKKTVQYFVDDMRKPVFEDKDFPFNPQTVSRSRMRIGNYGLSLGTVTHQIRDIELRRLEEKQEDKKSKTEGIVLLSGFSTGTYNMKSLLDFNGEKVSNFNLATFAVNEFVTNRFQYETLPALQGKKVPRLIVFCDVPVGQLIPEKTISRLKESVRKGSHLLILGGQYSLNKGEIAGTSFADFLPVVCGKPFDVEFFENPVELSDCPGATVSSVHRIKVREGAEVKTKVADLPFIVSSNYGFGKVTVVTGIPAWKDGDYAASSEWMENLKKLL